MVGLRHLTDRRFRMVGTITAALKHIQAELATLLDAPTILALCREMDDQWRERQLDPVTTVHLFLLHILHGNTACNHLSHLTGQRFTASAFCRRAPAYRSSFWSSCCGGRPPSVSRQPTTRDDGGGTAPSWSMGRVSRCPIPQNSKRRLANPAGSVRDADAPWPICSPCVMPARASSWRRSRLPGTPTTWRRWPPAMQRYARGTCSWAIAPSAPLPIWPSCASTGSMPSCVSINGRWSIAPRLVPIPLPRLRRGTRACPAPVGSASWAGRTNSSSG